MAGDSNGQANALTNGSTNGRRWDDPPPHDPPDEPESTRRSMVLVHKHDLQRFATSKEVLHLAFSPGDRAIVAMITPKAWNAEQDPWNLLQAWSFPSLLPIPSSPQNPFRTAAAFALSPKPDSAMACLYWPGSSDPEMDALLMAKRMLGLVPAKLEIHALNLTGGRVEKPRSKVDMPLQAPIAWSPDGKHIAAASTRDPSRIMVVAVGAATPPKVSRIIAGHTEDVTQIVFTPDGSTVVSAAKDGSIRATSLATGPTLRRVEVEVASRFGAWCSLMQISADGETVASIWGRDVVLWSMRTGALRGYSLNAVRQVEGWPLCISPDCRYLACRTEEGFDVSDLMTGKFRGDVVRAGSLVTAAAFSYDGRWLAVGRFNGEAQLYGVVA